MRTFIRRLSSLPLLSLMLLCLPLSSFSQSTWPSKTIRIVVPFPPGGLVDTVVRQVQPRLQAALGQTIVVENKGGAGGTVGVSDVVRSSPDGYTLVAVFDSFATYPLVYPKLAFDITKDLRPISQLASNPLVLVVHPSVKANNLKDFVEQVKAKPAAFNFASVGPGSSNHLTAELFKSVSGTFITHIPYRGGGPAQQDLLGGQIEMMFLSAGLAQPHVKAGKLKALAQTGSRRVGIFSEVPTVAESGYAGFDVNSWVGLLAPSATPEPIIEKLNAELNKILTNPEFVARLRDQGLTPIGNTPSEFSQVIAAERIKWGKLVTDRKLSLE
jgi:tripartite-type tricarboxylate transporter receptor subunit TctC